MNHRIPVILGFSIEDFSFYYINEANQLIKLKEYNESTLDLGFKESIEFLYKQFPTSNIIYSSTIDDILLDFDDYTYDQFNNIVRTNL